MSRREHRDRRCASCRLHQALCLCALVPRIDTRTRVVLAIHRDEARKPTNSGQLAARALASSSVVVIGERDRPLPTQWFEHGETPLLLFPGQDAEPLDAYAHVERPVLVVPDGTWRQAHKMGARIEALRGLPHVRITDTAPTSYRLRAETKPEGLATLEAIARALVVLERERGAEVGRALLGLFRVFVERTLWARGALADAELSDALPAAARSGVRG